MRTARGLGTPLVTQHSPHLQTGTVPGCRARAETAGLLRRFDEAIAEAQSTAAEPSGERGAAASPPTPWGRGGRGPGGAASGPSGGEPVTPEALFDKFERAIAHVGADLPALPQQAPTRRPAAGEANPSRGHIPSAAPPAQTGSQGAGRQPGQSIMQDPAERPSAGSTAAIHSPVAHQPGANGNSGTPNASSADADHALLHTESAARLQQRILSARSQGQEKLNASLDKLRAQGILSDEGQQSNQTTRLAADPAAPQPVSR